LVEQETTENPSFPLKSPALVQRPEPDFPNPQGKVKYPLHLAGKKSKQFQKTKFNSTSSLYINNSINAPDQKTLCKW
jgi:hypothetical protein